MKRLKTSILAMSLIGQGAMAQTHQLTPAQIEGIQDQLTETLSMTEHLSPRTTELLEHFQTELDHLRIVNDETTANVVAVAVAGAVGAVVGAKVVEKVTGYFRYGQDFDETTFDVKKLTGLDSKQVWLRATGAHFGDSTPVKPFLSQDYHEKLPNMANYLNGGNTELIEAFNNDLEDILGNPGRPEANVLLAAGAGFVAGAAAKGVEKGFEHFAGKIAPNDLIKIAPEHFDLENLKKTELIQFRN